MAACGAEPSEEAARGAGASCGAELTRQPWTGVGAVAVWTWLAGGGTVVAALDGGGAVAAVLDGCEGAWWRRPGRRQRGGTAVCEVCVPVCEVCGRVTG